MYGLQDSKKENANNTQKTLRFIHCNEQQLNTTKLHIIKYGITPLNIINNQRALNTWETIKRNIRYKIMDDFISDLLAIEIQTTTGNIIISTLYQPLARQYINTQQKKINNNTNPKKKTNKKNLRNSKQ